MQQEAKAGLDLANWNWKVVHRFVWERCGLSLCRSSCLNLRRLGFAGVQEAAAEGPAWVVALREEA